MKRLHNKPYPIGVSILECLLAIILLFSIAATMIGYFKATSRTQRITNGIVLTRDLLNVAAQYWQSNLTFDGLDDEVAIQSGLLPLTYTKLSSGNGIATPWTDISPDSRVNLSGNGNVATVVFTNLPQHACQPFGQQLKNAGRKVTLDCDGSTSSVTLTTQLDRG